MRQLLLLLVTIDSYHAEKGGDSVAVKALNPRVANLMRRLLFQSWMQELHSINVLAMLILRRSYISRFNNLVDHMQPSMGRENWDLLEKATIKPSDLKSREFGDEEVERYVKRPTRRALLDLLPYKVGSAEDLEDELMLHIHMDRAEDILGTKTRAPMSLEGWQGDYESNDSLPGKLQWGLKSE